MGTWFSLFNNWQTFAGQFLALALVIGSYLAAQYVRVWRPRRRGMQPAQFGQMPPEQPTAESAQAPALAQSAAVESLV
jgi:high-affinity iron transporter